MPLLQNYRDWRKVADTALPRNFIGYLTQLCLSPLRADPFTLLPYDDARELAKCGQAKGSLLGNLPERQGSRPEILKYIAPHRQTSQLTDRNMHELLAQAIDELVAAYSSQVVVRTSVLEKVGDALQLADEIVSPHAIARSTKREIAHVHTQRGSDDYSLHLCLSPADCKEAIGKGWGERMTLAGSLVPHEYLIIYTPRTKEEVGVVKSIIEAAILFMTGALGSGLKRG